MQKPLTICLCVLFSLVLLLGASCVSQTESQPTAKTAPASAPAAPTKAAEPLSSPTAPTKAAEPLSAPTAPAKAVVPASPPTVAVTNQPTVKLRVGALRNVTDVGLYAAQDKGYFKEQGLEVEFVDFATSGDSIAPLAVGQLDVGVGGIAAGFFNAINRAVEIKMVASKSAPSPDPKNGFTSSLGLVVRKDLVESGAVKDYKDLKGKTIAISGEGSVSHLILDRALRKGGLTLKDAEAKRIDRPEINLALANKAIDAAIQLEPQIAGGVTQGYMVRWKGAEEIYPGDQIGTIMYGPKVAEIGQNAGNRFMVAYLKGVRDYNDAFGPKRRNRAEMVALLVKYTSMKDAAMYDKMGWDFINPDGNVNTNTVLEDMDWFVANGFVKEKPDIRKVVDNTYADYAVKQLGKYQP